MLAKLTLTNPMYFPIIIKNKTDLIDAQELVIKWGLKQIKILTFLIVVTYFLSLKVIKRTEENNLTSDKMINVVSRLFTKVV